MGRAGHIGKGLHYLRRGLPQVAPNRIAAAVTQLVALGADPEQPLPGGSTALDYARAACPAEVQQALLVRPTAK